MRFAHFIILGVAAVWATGAYALDTFRLKGDDGKEVVIILHESPCVDKDVLEFLHDLLLDDRRFKKAHIDWAGEIFGGCWAETGGMVRTIGSDKEPIQPLPRRLFKDEGA